MTTRPTSGGKHSGRQRRSLVPIPLCPNSVVPSDTLRTPPLLTVPNLDLILIIIIIIKHMYIFI